jgi:hypothetical protein
MQVSLAMRFMPNKLPMRYFAGVGLLWLVADLAASGAGRRGFDLSHALRARAFLPRRMHAGTRRTTLTRTSADDSTKGKRFTGPVGQNEL